MNNKRLHIFNLIIFFVLISINVFIFKNRDNNYAYKEYLSYNQLYQNNEALSLVKTQFNGIDSLKLTLSYPQTNSYWQIQLPDSTSYLCEGNPVIKLFEGINNYKLKKIKTNDSVISIRLNFAPEKYYKQSGRNRSSDVELMQVSIPIKEDFTYKLNNWKQSSEYTTKDEIEIAKKILVDSINILQSDNSISKIHKISAYILSKIGNQIGIPQDNMDFISPLQQFISAQRGKSQVWCGNFASIFSFFANTDNIPTRSVWIEGNANGIPTAGHNFNECFIKELNQWIFIDLTSNTLSIETKNNKYLNSIDFYRAQQLHTSNLIATIYQNDSIKKINFNDNNSFYNNYFNPNIQFVYYYASQYNKKLYSFNEKIKRYFFKHPTLAIYSDTHSISNIKFYEKQIAILALLIFSIYWITLIILIRRNQ